MSKKLHFKPYSKLWPGPDPELASLMLRVKSRQIDKTSADDEPISSESNNFVGEILNNISFAINDIRVRLEASSNSKDIEQYSKSIFYLSNSFRNLIQLKSEE